MLSIAVCDDEALECGNIAVQIKKAVKELGTSCVIRQFFGGKKLLQTTERFDIVFLDIMMADFDGMKTAAVLRKNCPDILMVFITSTRKYVFEAYDVEAFQYLLKPVEEEKLKHVLQRAIKKIEAAEREFIVISKDRQQEKLFLDDIFYFEIVSRVIYAHGKGGISVFYEQIGVLEKSLQGKGFFRCHKSYLINLKYVSSYNKQEVTLDNGEKIVISKRRYEDFCKEILGFMRENGGIV